MWLRQFLSELGFPPSTPTIIYEDNKSAINIIQHCNDKSRTNHMDIRYHYIRELDKDHHVSVTYRPSSQVTADILTKPLDSKLFLAHLHSLLGSLVILLYKLRSVSIIFSFTIFILYKYNINIVSCLHIF